MLIFRYYLRCANAGKGLLHRRIDAVKPEVERYIGLAAQIKEKSRERKSLLAEKKSMPVLQIVKHRGLARRIAEITEDLEGLRAQKNLVLNALDCSDEGIAAVRRDIAAVEAGLQKLEQQERQYSAELDTALKEYAELQTQAADLDPNELTDARPAIRPDKERVVQRRIQSATATSMIP